MSILWPVRARLVAGAMAVMVVAAGIAAADTQFFMRRAAPGATTANVAPVWSTGENLDTVFGGPFASGSSINWSFSATDAQPVTYSVIGSLPGGLHLSGDTVSGAAPASVGSFQFTLSAKDNQNAHAERTFTFTTNGAPAWQTSSDLDSEFGGPFTPGGSVSWGFTATDNDPLTYSAVGPLPGGLHLSGSTVSGAVPASEGSFNFTLKATDTFGAEASRTFSFSTNAPPAWQTAANLNTVFSGPFTAGQSVSWGFSATDSQTVTLSVVGSLPGTLSLSGTTVSGQLPLTSTSQGFTLRATDSLGGSADRAFTFSTNWPTSCATALSSGALTTDGTITIDPDGTGPIASGTVYCIQTTNGGGWIRCANAVGGSSAGFSSAYNSGISSNYNFCATVASSTTSQKMTTFNGTTTYAMVFTYSTTNQFTNGGNTLYRDLTSCSSFYSAWFASGAVPAAAAPFNHGGYCNGNPTTMTMSITTGGCFAQNYPILYQGACNSDFNWKDNFTWQVYTR